MEHYTLILKPGDIVKQDNKIGLVVETKVRFYHGYCHVLWTGDTLPSWELADGLYEYYV